MIGKLKNIVEDLARDFLNNSLTLRYDICSCPTCRNDMLAYMLSKVPAKYVTTEQGEMYALSEQLKVEHQAIIARVCLEAIEAISKNPRHKVKEDRAQSFQLLLRQIFEDRGLDFRQYHQGVIKRKMAVRIRATGQESYAAYMRFLPNHPEEYDKLLETLCINVTEFFRDSEVWVTAKYLLENLISQKKQKNDKSIRIWSAGCSSGEEPYSIAIALKELLRAEPFNFTVEIYATDIDKKCLRDAQEAAYNKDSLKNVNEKYLKRYFTSLGDGRYAVNDEIKSMVKFQYLDLILNDNIKDTDVVFCRNVFIYFNRDLQEQILMKFYKSLKNGGYLIKGRAETIFSEAREIFKDIDSNARIYQKVKSDQ